MNSYFRKYLSAPYGKAPGLVPNKHPLFKEYAAPHRLSSGLGLASYLVKQKLGWAD
jgi:hypothetical protein